MHLQDLMATFPLSRRSAMTGLAATAFMPAIARSAATTLPSGYDVVLLAGQSNMEGYNSGTPDTASDAAQSPRVWQLATDNHTIIPAVDPLIQASTGNGAGLGMTFAKSYLRTLPTNRSVLLVGSAYGGTGFTNGLWQAPNGTLATNAVTRANAAMAAAGQGARFAGVLWHQGEADIIAGDSATYASNLANLIAFFRGSIKGATATTPFVCGETAYQWIYDNLVNNTSQGGSTAYLPAQNTILQDFHTLPDTISNTAWVSSIGLIPDANAAYGDIHFGALAQRQLGRRYADKFFEAANNLPQPATSLKIWAGAFANDGRSYPAGQTAPVSFTGQTSGTVAVGVDPMLCNVAQISKGQGSITYFVPGTIFNASYTKMAWFMPGSPGYYNNLVSAANPGQAHFLLAETFSGTAYLAVGHSDGSTIPVLAGASVAAKQGSWMHVAAVYDAAAKTMALYCNGAPVAVGQNVPAAPAIGGVVPLVMGGYGTYGAGVDGEMGGNRAWNSALTASQIAAIYAYESTARSGF